MKIFFSVCLGGAVGSFLRYVVSVLLVRGSAHGFPLATFTVNIIGSFLIGLFFAMTQRYEWFSPQLRLFFITGFCGGLTTFSTFAYENLSLLQSGNITLFIAYSVGSFVLSMLAVLAGIYVLKFF
ncbi:MAG: fluoride efflux transporter CrcB [Ilyomonas sp.]